MATKAYTKALWAVFGRFFLKARLAVSLVSIVGLVLMGSESASAQPQTATASTPAQVAISVTAQDQAAATSLVSARFHLMLAQTTAAKGAVQDLPSISLPKQIRSSDLSLSLPSPPSPSFYPDEVFNLGSVLHGIPGSTIATAKSHPIYLGVTNVTGDTTCGSATGSCWGNPNLFLSDFSLSTFSHLLDQYAGSSTSNRYPEGTIFTATTTVFAGTSGVPTLSENDILQFVHSAAKNSLGGSGLGHIYHFFIPAHVDTCMDEGPCYSPDNAKTFVFCAYHSRVVFSDIPSPVYYTVQPFQDVAHCQVPASSPTPPNGQLADSTNSTLSHELSESITDPDLTTGFRSLLSNASPLQEIGDLCQSPLSFTESLNGHSFEIQLEYSNTYEACASSP
jgi:hypothetical protein